MNYLRAKQKRNRTIVLSAIGVVALFLIIFFRTPLTHAGKAVWNFVMWPVWQLDNFVRDRFADAIISRATKRSLTNEILTLRDELQTAQQKNIAYDALKADYDRFVELSTGGTIVATVMRDPLLGHDTLVLDRGSAEGVSVGDTVFASEHIVIGEIGEVFDHRSIAKLYSLSDIKTEAIVSSDGRAVVLSGRGGGNFEIMLPKDTVIDPGTSIVLPTRVTSVVAIVDRKISDEYDPFTKYIARLAVNPNELRFVIVQH